MAVAADDAAGGPQQSLVSDCVTTRGDTCLAPVEEFFPKERCVIPVGAATTQGDRLPFPAQLWSPRFCRACSYPATLWDVCRLQADDSKYVPGFATREEDDSGDDVGSVANPSKQLSNPPDANAAGDGDDDELALENEKQRRSAELDLFAVCAELGRWARSTTWRLTL